METSWLGGIRAYWLLKFRRGRGQINQRNFKGKEVCTNLGETGRVLVFSKDFIFVESIRKRILDECEDIVQDTRKVFYKEQLDVFPLYVRETGCYSFIF